MRHSSLVIVAILLISFFFSSMQYAQAYQLTIQPDRFPFSGTAGQLINKTSIVTNQGNTSAILKIRYNASGLLVLPATLTVQAGSSQNIVILYTLQKDVSSGNITLSLNGSNITVSVIFKEKILSELQAPVDVFPKPPVSGSDIAIFFTGTSKGLSAKGFLYVNGLIYTVDINGYGIVSLGKNAYGTATLYLFGDSILANQSKKTFDIQKGAETLVSIAMAKDSTIGTDVAVIVKYGQDPLSNVEVKITDPDEDQQTYTTNNQGKIEFNPDSIGKWKATVTAMDQVATANTDVQYGVLSVGIVEEEYTLGDTVTIVTDPGATIEVYVDGEMDFSRVAPSDGLLSLPLTRGGTYLLKGELEKEKGEFTFSIPGRAEILVLDQATQTQVQRLEKNKQYTVEVVDSSGNPVTEAESLWISNPFGTKEILTLTEGVGTWFPFVDGAYTLTVDDLSTMGGNSRYIFIKPVAADFGIVTPIIIAVVTLCLILLGLIIVAKRRKIPVGYMIKNLFKGKKKIELPIG